MCAATNLTRASAADRAYAAVKRSILSGETGAGDELGEVALAERLECSRTPVREALQRLQSEGLVRIYPKRGAIVVPVTAAEADAVWEARALVEQWAAPRAFEHGTAIAARLHADVDAMELHRAVGDVVAFTEADRAFHEVVVDAAHNEHLTRLYRSLRERQLMINATAMTLSPERMDAAIRDHRRLAELIATDDLDAFVALTASHVASARHAIDGDDG
ncbi:DNA-binding GntR family transcriptional regulator [Mumia flava]|uniref:DNA-binding GntR family transcriptional regulator n=1 Tax=Mumia flava TaxID=1348852 RepID=A0A2M9AQ71_9ACTN|nr:GntR family transcriptional regulator [Mumia flava]PJJ47840.1 DNA-binding GntR family transcriptional regulator [Mumia flava]